MEVLRIISLGNGWLLDTCPLGGSVDFNLHDRMRVASNLDQLKDEVALWATRSIAVPAAAVPEEDEEELHVPIDQAEDSEPEVIEEQQTVVHPHWEPEPSPVSDWRSDKKRYCNH